MENGKWKMQSVIIHEKAVIRHLRYLISHVLDYIRIRKIHLYFMSTWKP
jgi:hypothetical protein